MKAVCFCMSRRYTDSILLYVREDSMKGVCFCMSEKIYRLNEGGLLLYVREDIPTQ